MISTSQVDNGIVDITKIDTTKFALKTETATKEELQTLTSAVAGKLDASPIHHHDIADIDQLQTSLNDKLSSTQRYSYESILSNPEQINYLDELKTTELEISTAQNQNGYSFTVDNNGDLLLVLGNVAIARYDTPTSSWLFSNVNINEVLSNHHDAIEALAGHYDNNGTMTTSNIAISSTAHIPMTVYSSNSTPTILFGNAGGTNNSAGIKFDSTTSPKCLSFGFCNNDDKFTIDTNGNCVATGSLTASSLTLNQTTSTVSWMNNLCVFNNNLANGQNMSICFGKNKTTNYACGQITFTPDTTNPYVHIDMCGAPNLLKVYKDKVETSSPVIASNVSSDNETRLAQCENIITTPSSHDYITKISNDKPFEINIDINDKTISFTNHSTNASMSNSIRRFTITSSSETYIKTFYLSQPANDNVSTNSFTSYDITLTRDGQTFNLTLNQIVDEPTSTTLNVVIEYITSSTVNETITTSFSYIRESNGSLNASNIYGTSLLRMMNQMKMEILKSVFPLHSIYTTTDSTVHPNEILGFGVWTLWNEVDGSYMYRRES